MRREIVLVVSVTALLAGCDHFVGRDLDHGTVEPDLGPYDSGRPPTIDLGPADQGVSQELVREVCEMVLDAQQGECPELTDANVCGLTIPDVCLEPVLDLLACIVEDPCSFNTRCANEGRAVALCLD